MYYEETIIILNNQATKISEFEVIEDEAIPVDVYIRNDYEKRLEAGFRLLNDGDETM